MMTACLVLFALAGGVNALAEDLEVVLTSQSPYPVEPGEEVDIEVYLQNTGYAGASNVVLEITPEDPFTLMPGQSAEKSFNSVPAQDHVTASYKLHVDKEAISGNYGIKFKYRTSGSDYDVQDEITVQVQGNTKLVLSGIETSPEKMEPGDTVTITAKIKNVGTGTASFMEAALISNTSYILPVLSGGTYYMGKIMPGETKNAVFHMSIENSAEYMTYSGVLSLSYKDESGDTQSTTFSVGFPVRGEPLIEILSAKVDDSTYKVDIENIGTASAKALKVVLVQNGEIIDSSVSNEVKATKHKTFRFSGFTYGQAIINMTYLNENNEYFNRKEVVTIKKSAYSDTDEGGVSPFLPILIVVVILESYYVWRLRRMLKNRREKRA